ncbi:MAG: hypothetical protein JWQ43_1092 [Glaciihabitans sp.]|nr:hypothetical protein [Glaciihabitans sp.]
MDSVVGMDPETTHSPGDLAEVVNRIRQPVGVPPSPDDQIQAIRFADELEKMSTAHLHSVVSAARANGVPWQLIGDALGTSRQGAFRRFGSGNTSQEGESTMSQPLVDLVSRTESVFQSLAANDFASVKSMMTFSCSRVLTKKKVMGVWGEVLSASGTFESCSGTVVQTPDGRNLIEQLWNQHLSSGVVGQTQLNHEAGEWKGRVAFTAGGKIAGLLIVSPEAKDLPF